MMTWWPECLKIAASSHETRSYFQKGQVLTNSRSIALTEYIVELWSDAIFEFGCGTIESGVSKPAAVF